MVEDYHLATAALGLRYGPVSKADLLHGCLLAVHISAEIWCASCVTGCRPHKTEMFKTVISELTNGYLNKETTKQKKQVEGFPKASRKSSPECVRMQETKLYILYIALIWV